MVTQQNTGEMQPGFELYQDSFCKDYKFWGAWIHKNPIKKGIPLGVKIPTHNLGILALLGRIIGNRVPAILVWNHCRETGGREWHLFSCLKMSLLTTKGLCCLQRLYFFY
jgi:hypothetical protein